MTYVCVSWDDSAIRTRPERGKEDARPVPVVVRDPDDDDLLHRIAENDEVAFRMLVERHVDRAFALALRILDNRADADDVVQDSLLKVWMA
jgi:RNA polymerase sigma-70 factor, ECF subfamily